VSFPINQIIQKWSFQLVVVKWMSGNAAAAPSATLQSSSGCGPGSIIRPNSEIAGYPSGR